MPRILTKRPGPCSVCQGRIGKGEYAEFSAGTGTVHLECVGGKPQRTNAKPARCSKCRADLAPGMGRLQLQEEKLGPSFQKRWIVSCLRGC